MADAKRVVIIDLNIETNKYLKSITEARREVERLKATNKELANDLKNAGEIGSASWNKANRAIVENEAQLRKAKGTLGTLQKELDNLGKTQTKQAEEAQKASQAQIDATEKARQASIAQAQAEQELQSQREEANQSAIDKAQELELAMQTMGDTIGEALGGTPEQQELLQNITNTKVALAELAQNNKTLTEGLKGVSVGSAEYKKITQAIAENEAQTRQAKGELTNYTKQLDNLGKVNKANEGSYEKLYRQYVDAEVKLKTLANTVKVNADGTIVLTAEYKKAQAEVLKLKEGLLEFNAGIKDGRLNVGNYTQSFQQAIQNTGLFGQAIGQVQGIIQSGTSVYNAVTQGTKLIADGYNTTVDAIKEFGSTWGKTNDTVTSGTQVLEQGSTAVGKVGESAKETVADLDKVGDSAGKAGAGVSQGMTIGARGTQILKLGLQSIGIGLIITAVVALISYFSKFQSGIDKLKQVMSGLTAVFETVIGTIVDIATAIATLDFGKAIDSLTSFGGKAVESANKAMQLEKAKQALEQRDIDNIATQGELKRAIEDLQVASEDKTKTDQERIDALKEAGDLEKQLLQNQLDREAEALRILQEENAEKKKRGQLSREDAKAEAELTETVLNLKDSILDKEKEVASQTSKLRKQLRADEINSTVGLLQDQLRVAQLAGKDTVKLAKDIAKQERDAKLEDTQLSAKQRELVESNYQVKLLEIEAEARDARKQKAEQYSEAQKQLARATTDALLNTIVDGKTRELAIEAEALQRKLADIKGNGAKEEALRTALTQESATKILEIERNYAEQSLTQSNETLKRNLDQQKAQVEANIKAKQNALELDKSKGLISEEDYQQSLLGLEIQKNDQLLELQKEYTVSRQVNESLYFDNLEKLAKEKLDKKTITEKQYNEQLAQINKDRATTQLATETETQAELTTVTEAGNDARLQMTVATNEQILKTTKETAEAQKLLQNQLLDATRGALSSFSQLLGKNEADRKKNAKAIQALAKAEILINAYQEISGYWEGAGKDSGKSVIAGTGAVVLAGILSASAIARAIANINAVNAQKFAEGGYTVADAMAEYMPTVKNGYSGGYVSSPTMWQGGDGGMKLAGEAGTEWVSPSWQIRQAPEVFASLGRWRRTGVRTFADGGFTSSTISAPIINTSEILENSIAKGFANAPAPVVAVTEINDVQTRVSVIESRSSL